MPPLYERTTPNTYRQPNRVWEKRYGSRDANAFDPPKWNVEGPKIALWSIIGLTMPTFFAWRYTTRDYTNDQVIVDSVLNAMNSRSFFATSTPPLADFIVRNCLMSRVHLERGYWWTLITSTFTHFKPQHLISNVFSLYQSGNVLVQQPRITIWDMLAIPLGAGVAGNLVQLWQYSQERDAFASVLFFGKKTYVPTLSGASGMVMGYGVAATLSTWYLSNEMQLATMAAAVLTDLVYLGSTRSTGIGHAAHLGGAAFGALYYFAFLRKRMRKSGGF